jgi:hypothetical protein
MTELGDEFLVAYVDLEVGPASWGAMPLHNSP